MFGEELRRLVRRGVAELDRDVEMLESLLAAARDARDLFQEVVSQSEVVDSVDSPADGYGAGFPPLREESETALPVTGRFVTGPRAHSYSEFEQALLTSGESSTYDLVGMAKIWADLHDGMVLSRDLAAALRAMGLSKSSMENLPGYLSRKMIASGKFEREGHRGSGRYRWLSYWDYPAYGDASGESADDEAAVPSGLSEGGTDSLA